MIARTSLVMFLLALPAAAEPPRTGIALPWGLQVHGKFDVAYERARFTDDPTDGDDALRNFHHFIFLTRSDPNGWLSLNAELVDLTFYDIGAVIRPGGPQSRWSGSIHAGKILVPFGSDPLFHHSYGGRSGFDQQLLPVIWTVHGASAQIRVRIGPVALVDDLYVVQGYRLPSEDAVLNLQTDFSRADDVTFGFGDRLGLAWGPLTAWYSVYANAIGHGRWLVMQALDIGVWRIPDIPVLSDLAVSIGVVRADVSGGGAGRDYYHFADYVEVRYYPLDWLYVQYRAGLRTMDNRRDLYKDDRRLTSDDTSSHNVGVVYTRSGLTAGIYMFFNLEQADEKDDDFLRTMVGYDF